MKTKTTPDYVHKVPAFVTAEEISQLEVFEKDLSNFSEQMKFLVVPFAALRRDEAREVYNGEPTFKNFIAFKQTALDEAFTEKLLPSSVRAVVENARDKLIKTKLIPWAQLILDRGLKLVQERLDQISAEEAKRHKDLTGEEFTQSGITEAAKRPVTELERLLRDISPENTTAAEKFTHSIFPYLRARQAPTD